jgi:deoxyribodipyrimidine photo-lyase
MTCLTTMRRELEETGWLVNQARMWVASHWSVRQAADWRRGEDWLFRHLLDGSRAANRLGWQWTSGVAGGRVYGFSRWQVEKRAPALCARCELGDRCPIGSWPDDVAVRSRSDAKARLSADPDLAATAGPAQVERRGAPEAVWLTAESLGDADPALASNAERPAVFVFDEPLLARLRLSRKRLVFLVETLGDLAQRRPLELHLGDPVAILQGRPLAATRAPVPGWRRRSRALEIVELHPWPWLVPPHAGPIGSYSAWRKRVCLPGARRREATAGPGGRRQR